MNMDEQHRMGLHETPHMACGICDAEIENAETLDEMRRERDRALEYAEMFHRQWQYAIIARNTAMKRLAEISLAGKTDAEIAQYAANLKEDQDRRAENMPKPPKAGDPEAAAAFKKLIGWTN